MIGKSVGHDFAIYGNFMNGHFKSERAKIVL